VHRWFEWKISQGSDANIDQAERRMIDCDVTATLCAITAIADVAALESAEELAAFREVTLSFFHNVNALTGAAE
jgi:hypothetical protein